MTARIFISYSSKDSEIAQFIHEELTKRGVDVFIDYRSIDDGDDFFERIAREVEERDRVLFLVSQHSVGSKWVKIELQHAFENDKPITPIALDDTAIPRPLFFVGKLHRRAFTRTQEDITRLCKVLGVTDATSPPRPLSYAGAAGGTIGMGAFTLQYPMTWDYIVRAKFNDPANYSGNFVKKREGMWFTPQTVATGLPVLAAQRGRVSRVENYPPGYGKYVCIEHKWGADTFVTWYGHMDQISVKVGDNVNAGQQIGTAGRTGSASEISLFFTVQNLGKGAKGYVVNDVVDPLVYLVQHAGGEKGNSEAESVPTPLPVPRIKRPSSLELMPQPFAWIDIPGTIGKTWTGEPYKIAKYPVTNAQYRVFVEAGGYYQEKWWTEEGWKYRQNENWTQPRYWKDLKWNGEEQPVVGVSWYEAIAFCRWLSDLTGEKIMLPTEDQWQYAAQGDDGREYPWGNGFDAKRCNTSESKIGKTNPVRQYEGKGDSPLGVVDMAGNVWEWCATANQSESYRMLRGGSWGFDLGRARAVSRLDYNLGNRYDVIGFRVVVSVRSS